MSHRLTVRSYCRPAVTEKSASSTTFDHGPVHCAGGVYVHSRGFAVREVASPWSSNATSVYSLAVQGVPAGRGTGASAMATPRSPAAGDVCAAASALGKISARARLGRIRWRMWIIQQLLETLSASMHGMASSSEG